MSNKNSTCQEMYKLSRPKLRTHYITNDQMITWYLEDENRNGYFINWVEAAFDTRSSECMAFRMKRGNGVSWNEVAVSYESSPSLALASIIDQLSMFDDLVPALTEIEHSEALDAEEKVLQQLRGARSRQTSDWMERVKVTVESATNRSMTLISKAAGMCYGKDDAKLSRVRSCVKKGHTSVIEHVSATFKIEGISRACLAQLTRHRIASFSVMSQRYCKVGGEDWYVMPPLDKEADVEAFGDVLGIAMDTYKEAIARGIKPEDARFLLPEATKTSLYMTINARSLQNFLALRLSKTAQWEIRELASKIEQVLIDLGGEWADLMNILSEVRNG